MEDSERSRRSAVHTTSAPADDLQAFLGAVQRPLAFLAKVPAAAARTHVPVDEWVTRARALLAGVDGEPRALLTALSAELARYPDSAPEMRPALVERCLRLIEQLAGAPGPSAPRGKDAAAGGGGPQRAKGEGVPSYRGTTGDLAAMLEQLAKPVQFVHGVGPRRAELLRKSGIERLEDLLYHLPFRYEDRREVKTIAQLRVGDQASVLGELTHLAQRRVGRAQRHILEGVLRDPSGLLGLTWYHQVAYFRNRFRPGQRVRVYGKVEFGPDGGRRIVHPEVELEPEDAAQGILPVYQKPTTMTVGAMRKLMARAVLDFASSVPSALPATVAAQARVVDSSAALREVHLPQAGADVARLNAFDTVGHRSLVFEELFFLQLGMVMRRRAVAREPGRAQPRRGPLTDRLAAALPFRLTASQDRVLREVYADLASPHPMHRLVQGDVGSGKTMVALFAALVAIENGHQAAFMAPTELLAEQHFRTVSAFTETLGVRAVLLTGALSRADRSRVLADVAAGSAHLVVGTHALIQDAVRFRAIGLGVIDEQHRFGVLQRAALRRLGGNGDSAVMPDILLMTATPIPRTLSMTIYGDLDVSVLDELPPGRQPVRTLILNEAERPRAYQLVRQELQSGRQGYVVYPLVESSEKEDLRDATTMAKELGATVFPGARVGLVHGRMKAAEKDAVMRRFRDGDVQLLVSTTVIEVGVDVPNATIMIVEHADRFGLSQLHQLRGRVGRGSDHATCVLMAPYHQGEVAYQRLKAMARTTDGFKIAEVDLEIRGPGEFLGTRQSGLPDFRVANLIRDSRLLSEARRLAEAWLETDPMLSGPASSGLRVVLRHRWAGRLGLAEIG